VRSVLQYQYKRLFSVRNCLRGVVSAAVFIRNSVNHCDVTVQVDSTRVSSHARLPGLAKLQFSKDIITRNKYQTHVDYV
jgi:hypothetical protein